MGFPVQERVCTYLSEHSSHGVFIGEGGTFDYERFGGQRPKAPSWIQRIGLEWLWRLVLEPRRLGRQLAIPRFIYRIWRDR
jgi:N-acetylglucosaminyldiphosphoundecaprenol N-acetyl-beta-D-mannosaminyltransferase